MTMTGKGETLEKNHAVHIRGAKNTWHPYWGGKKAKPFGDTVKKHMIGIYQFSACQLLRQSSEAVRINSEGKKNAMSSKSN